MPRDTHTLIANITASTRVFSDHYTNYVKVEGRLSEDKDRMLRNLEDALSWDESRFRPHFIGTQ